MSDSKSAREIIERLVKQSGITKKAAAELLHVIPGIIEEGLKKDGEVRVKGLGTFRVKEVRAKVGRNPKTGERVEIPPHSRVVFLPEQSFKDYINRDYRLLSYKIIPPAEKVHSAVENITEPESILQSPPEPEPGPPIPPPQSQPQPQRQPEPESQFEPEPGTEPSSGRRRVHWIIPVAISVVIILSLIFYFRNCYHSSHQPSVVSRQSAVSSQQSAVDSQRPVPTAEPEGAASDSSQQSTVSSQQSTVSSQQSEIENQQLTIDNRQSTPSPQQFTVTESQHLFQLAREIYGNPYLWVLIYRANQDKITDPDILVSGKELAIPVLEGTTDHLTRNDSLDVSEGYRLLYEYFSSKGDLHKDDFFKAMERYKPK